jgi:hypothetical protein
MITTFERWLAQGKIVLEFDVRGCMAEDHVLKNVWEIVEFGYQNKFIKGSQKIHMARCRLVKSRDDLDDEYILIPSHDLYALPPGSFGQSIGYAWRH